MIQKNNFYANTYKRIITDMQIAAGLPTIPYQGPNWDSIETQKMHYYQSSMQKDPSMKKDTLIRAMNRPERFFYVMLEEMYQEIKKCLKEPDWFKDKDSIDYPKWDRMIEAIKTLPDSITDIKEEYTLKLKDINCASIWSAYEEYEYKFNDASDDSFDEFDNASEEMRELLEIWIKELSYSYSIDDTSKNTILKLLTKAAAYEITGEGAILMYGFTMYHKLWILEHIKDLELQNELNGRGYYTPINPWIARILIDEINFYTLDLNCI